MTKPKQRGGQPRTGDIANNRLVVLLDDAEWARLNELAEAAGMVRSDYVRYRLLGKKPPK